MSIKGMLKRENRKREQEKGDRRKKTGKREQKEENRRKRAESRKKEEEHRRKTIERRKQGREYRKRTQKEIKNGRRKLGMERGWNQNVSGEEEQMLDALGYRIRNFLGSGQFARVYLVEKEGKRAACKISRNKELLEREAQNLSRLRHSLFPAFIAFEKSGQYGYLFMEYLEGENLVQSIAAGRKFGRKGILKMGREIASGLQYLHESCGMVYRDLKPANLIFCKNGRVKLIDAGCICKLGERKSLAGSPGFAAPEQLLAGVEADAGSDVYGLAKTLESLLGASGTVDKEKGKEKWKGKWTRHRSDRRWQRVYRACTEKNLEKRVPDMRSMASLLEYAEGKRRKKNWERVLLGGKVTILENIWKSCSKKP